MESYLGKHRDKDIELSRETLIGIIGENFSSATAKVNATKLLMRMHHALQVDKIVSKGEAPKQDELSKEEMDEIEARIGKIT